MKLFPTGAMSVLEGGASALLEIEPVMDVVPAKIRAIRAGRKVASRDNGDHWWYDDSTAARIFFLSCGDEILMLGCALQLSPGFSGVKWPKRLPGVPCGIGDVQGPRLVPGEQ